MDNIQKIILVALIIIMEMSVIILLSTSMDIFETREGLRPRDGISIGHNENLRLDDVTFYIIASRDVHEIEVRFSVSHIDSSSPGKIGIFFPYPVELTTDSEGWENLNILQETVFMKKFTCTDENNCRFHYNEQLSFEIMSGLKFDSKVLYQHGIKVKFDSTVSTKADEFFREYNLKSNPLEFRYDDTTKRQITIIIPERADKIHALPIPSPDIFHNAGRDYSNVQLNWNLDKENQALLLDYELLDERKRFEVSQLQITITGIILVLLGFLWAMRKPKYQGVFESNRQTNLRFIFNDLERYHDHAVFIFDEFEKKFGNLVKKRKELVTTIKFVPIEEISKQKPVNFADIMKDKQALDELNERLKFNFDQMKEISNFFEKESRTLETYFENSFLQHIRQIFWQTNYYTEQLFNATLVPSCLESSIDRAKKIIEYLKKDSSLDLSEESVKSFINRWEKAFENMK